jgi:hypothetical protein
LAHHDFNYAVSEGVKVLDKEHLFNFFERGSQLLNREYLRILRVFIELLHQLYNLMRLEICDKKVHELVRFVP